MASRVQRSSGFLFQQKFIDRFNRNNIWPHKISRLTVSGNSRPGRYAEIYVRGDSSRVASRLDLWRVDFSHVASCLYLGKAISLASWVQPERVFVPTVHRLLAPQTHQCVESELVQFVDWSHSSEASCLYRPIQPDDMQINLCSAWMQCYLYASRFVRLHRVQVDLGL